MNDHQAEIAAALGDRIVRCDQPEDPAAFERALSEARGRRRAAPEVLPGDTLRAALRERLTALTPARRTPLVWGLLERVTRGVALRGRGRG